MTDTQSKSDTPAKRSLLSRAVSLVTRPVAFVARTLYTGLDNAIYNAPRLRPCLRDGLYVPSALAIAIAVFNVLVLTGTLGSYPGVFIGVNIISLVLSLGVLLPTRRNSQTHNDSTWLLAVLFSDRPSREVAPEPAPVAKKTTKKAPSSARKPAAKKPTAKKATTKKPATKSTAKKVTPSATKASATTKTKTATKNRPTPRTGSSKRSKK